MIELDYIARPLIGAVIGYITNDIAIRMLFRPRTPKYLFGIKLPFTPGIIPKEKPRIAASIGKAISENLMNREVMERTLLSDEMTGKIETAVTSYVETQKANSETLREYLSRYLTPENIADIQRNASADLAEQIHTSLATAAMGPKIASMVVDHVIDKMRSGMLGMLGADQFISRIAAPVESLLAKNINEMLANNSQKMVGTMIDDQIDSLLGQPMSRLFSGHDEQIVQAREAILSLYRRLVSEQLPRILTAVDISRIVEERINDMDMEESERLILSVMKKELKAIVWLGALLGFVMGCVNLLF